MIYQGSASCKVTDSKAVNFGEAVNGLEATSDGVKLVYEASSVPDGCPQKPTTTVYFKCPHRGGVGPELSRNLFLMTHYIYDQYKRGFISL